MTDGSVDRWLDRRQTLGYDCASFARDVWLDLTGLDIGAVARGLLDAQSVGKIPRCAVRSFRELEMPIDPCLVLMRQKRGGVHMGVYIRKNILHLKSNGVEYQPVNVATRLHDTIQYIGV
jgi:hypothetical protein